MPPRPRHRIPLTHDLLANASLVGETIDQVLLSDRTLRRLHRQIARRQSALRAVVDEEQWRLYMVIEELFNDRWFRALTLVARQFYTAGQCSEEGA